ncbi:MAG TPA: DedA family protein [Spirochaetota bacterium]|nr:DedA family protein [Spirochaetota bacterium]
MEAIISLYGYYAVVIGTFLEGETILIIAGFLAHRGYLNLYWVIAAAFTGSFIGDQLYFTIGRYRGNLYLLKHPGLKPKVERFLSLMNRYKILIIISFRFLYGLRTVAPFAIGLSDISFKKFFILNLLSAAAWAAAFGIGGYLFGHALEAVIDDLKKFEYIIIAVIVLIAAILFIIKHSKNKKIHAERR